MPYTRCVSYRDDLDAAIARADALEQEVAELKTKAAALEARGTHDEQALADLQRHDLLERAKLREQAEAARREAARIALEADIAQQHGRAAQPRRRPVRRAPASTETSASTAGRGTALAIACILAATVLMIGGLVASELSIAAVAFALIILLVVAMLLRRE